MIYKIYQMQGERQSSTRFLIQMAINIFVCKKGYEVISKMAIKSDKIEKKSVAVFLVFGLTLFLLNQGAFMFFKDKNLYELVGVPRKMNIAQITQWSLKRRVQLYQIRSQPATLSQEKFQNIISVLTHPARRLSYDSFGQHEVNYAWAFKSPTFILQTIIGSAVFFIICTFMSTMNKKKSDIKQAFKLQICTMIFLFLWEVDLIVTTESRLQNFRPDLLDYVYTAFPIFERREMIKAIIIPCMSLVQMFVRFYTIGKAQKKILQYGNIELLKKQTNPVYDHVSSLNMDEHIEDRMNVALETLKGKYPLQAQAYRLQRDLIRALLYVEGEQILPRPQVVRVLKYFKLQ